MIIESNRIKTDKCPNFIEVFVNETAFAGLRNAAFLSLAFPFA